MNRSARLAIAWLLLGLIAAAGDAVATSPDAALDVILEEARGRVPQACSDPAADALVRLLCKGRMRIGVRANYPLFATNPRGDPEGYDIDVARVMADRLGVEPVWVPVTAATRIAMLAEGRVDLVVATMGHNTRRDREARFIRPHYYSSETILVGATETAVEDWEDLPGNSVCVTIGNYANAHIASRGARLMLFDDAGRLPKGLLDETCLLAAQDDSFFASYLAAPSFADRFEPKFGFDRVPWGMAVPATGSERLAEALDLISQILHRDGVFLEIARRHGIFTEFLEAQQARWNEPVCADAAAIGDPSCVMPALEATPPPTSFAPTVELVLGWLNQRLGLVVSLPMLTTEPAWNLFRAGIVNSLILVGGALFATLVFALLIGAAASSASILLRAPAWLAVVTLQSSPVILTLVVAAAIAHAIFPYSSAVALGSAIIALGLMNGANAAQAIGEAATSLRAERGDARALAPPLFAAAVGRSATQILSFLVNATKGTPIASFTGAPELLSALTEITSFASARTATYTLVLLFYLGVVAMVVWVCERTRRRLTRRRPA